MPRFVCVSDTHQSHMDDLPEGEFLLFGGDMCEMRAPISQVEEFARWFGGFPHKHKIAIAGNHDEAFEEHPDRARDLLATAGITYLENSGITLDGVRFWGSPHTPWYARRFSHFSLQEEDELVEAWAKIPSDTQVLITHTPPYGILDQVAMVDRVRYSGCSVLKKRLTDLSDLRLHLFGHIHESYGHVIRQGIHYVNATHRNMYYLPENGPISVDVEF